MDFMWIGSVNQYTKALARQTQWKLKKQSGDFKGHQRSLRDQVSVGSSPLHREPDEVDTKLSAIVSKAQAGKKLSEDEWEYLKENAPEFYEKLRAIEREQKAYEEALKRCKTRDEAQRLHVSKLGEIMEAVKNEDASALIRLNRMTQTMIAFTESEEYHKLPTEAEQAIERESERQEKAEALREEAELREAEKEKAASRSEAEGGAEAEPTSEAKADTEAKPVFAGGDAPHAEETRRAVPRAAERTVSHPRDPAVESKTAPAEGGAPSAVPFGQRAYLDQQRGESHARPRRRTFDAEA